MYALEVKALSKRFGDVKAVNNASFSVPEGSIFGLIGRNGAGKTTIIRMMMSIYLPDAGEIILRGTRIGRAFKDISGYLPEERGLYKKMKVMDLLMFFAEIKGKTGEDVKKKALAYLERFSLQDRKDSKIEDLSKGNQQKVQFISTILHDPEFIILDEPFSGLDPVNTNILKEIILQLKRLGKVIIFSTHLMDFAENMCDDIAMIDNGKIILNGSLKSLKERFGQRSISLKYDGDISFLNSHPIIDGITDSGHSISIKIKKPAQTQELLKILIENSVTVRSFDTNEISLQDIFIEHAGVQDDDGEEEGARYVE